jgi:hypothetical protein
MASGSEQKNWWETNLDWNLADSLQETVEAGNRMIRSLPSALSAHHLGKSTPIDSVGSDPVEKIKAQQPSEPARSERQPKMLAAPPKPACLQKKLNNSQSIKLRAVNFPPLKEDKPKPKLTLEMLLDPEFCDY